MLILDVETTGTNSNKHSLLSIGAIDFLKPERQFYEECRIWEGAHVDDEALAVNGFTKKEITDSSKKTEAEIVKKFLAWAMDSSEHTIGGQNPFFDVSFIQAASVRANINFFLAHRIIDLHTMCYFHMIQKEIEPPIANKRSDLNSDTIMKYVGIPAEPKPHIALNGAKWEAEAFSRLMYNRAFFKEFEKYKVPWRLNNK